MPDLRVILEQWGLSALTLYHWLDTDRGPIAYLHVQQRLWWTKQNERST